MINIDVPLQIICIGCTPMHEKTMAIRARRVVQGWLREICDPERTYVGMSHNQSGEWILHVKFIGGDERGNAMIFKLRHHDEDPLA